MWIRISEKVGVYFEKMEMRVWKWKSSKFSEKALKNVANLVRKP